MTEHLKILENIDLSILNHYFENDDRNLLEDEHSFTIEKGLQQLDCTFKIFGRYKRTNFILDHVEIVTVTFWIDYFDTLDLSIKDQMIIESAIEKEIKKLL